MNFSKSLLRKLNSYKLPPGAKITFTDDRIAVNIYSINCVIFYPLGDIQITFCGKTGSKFIRKIINDLTPAFIDYRNYKLSFNGKFWDGSPKVINNNNLPLPK